MLYVKLDENGNAVEPPIALRHLRRRLNNVSIPAQPTEEDLSPFGYAIVPPDKIGPPDVSPGYSWRIGIPEKVDGQWQRRWDVYPMSPEEHSDRLKGLRKRRDLLLSSCDWTQMPDSSLDQVTKQLWAEYRQQLRDLPNDPNLNLKNIQWPSRPV